MRMLSFLLIVSLTTTLLAEGHILSGSTRFPSTTLQPISKQGSNKGYRFERIPSELGLSQNAIYAILQDSKGLLWFGTKDGLNRFDGYEFSVFRHDPTDSTSISDSYVTALYEDRAGRIWVGTNAGGLNLFDPKTEIFHRIPLKSLGLRIEDITEGPEGAIWVGTDGGGLIKLVLPANARTPESAVCTHFTHEPHNPNSLAHNHVSDVLVDSTGAIWVAGFLKKRIGLNKLTKREDGRGYDITRYDFDPSGERPHLNYFRTLCQDRQGILWLSGLLDGLIRFDPVSETSTYYPLDVKRYARTWQALGAFSILADRGGFIWLSTTDALTRFDPTTESFTYFPYVENSAHGLPNQGAITSIYQDRGGVLWFGFNGKGLFKFDPAAGSFYHPRRDRTTLSLWRGTSIRSICETRDGTLLIGTIGEGIYKVNRKTGDLSRLSSQDSLSKWLNSGTVFAIHQDRLGNLWLGKGPRWFGQTAVSLLRIRWRSGQAEAVSAYDPNPYRTQSASIASPVYKIYQDRKGHLWVMTNTEISRFNRESESFTPYRFNPADSGSIRDWTFPTLYEDNDGIFWLGTIIGLIRFNPQDGSFKYFQNDPGDPSSLNHNVVRAVHPDPFEPDRCLWLGTAGGGLNRFDKVTESFTHFTERDGLPNNVIYAILSDRNGNLWMSTNNGLSRLALPRPVAGEGFNAQELTFKNYNIADGLQDNEFNSGAYFKSTSGELFFGGISGFNAFYPEEIKDNPHIPPIVLTDFQIFNQSVSFKAPDSPLKMPISEVDEITLSYANKVFSFEFAALDYSEPAKNQYAFMMENFDDDWQQAGTSRSTTYTNLDPGEYVFHVKGSNNDGVWNEEGTSIKIIITPPWWQTWWAYSLYVLFALVALYGIRRYELNRMHLKNRARMERMEAAKWRELDQMKSRFFANISHEFRTPLTLILGQIESLQAELGDQSHTKKLDMAIRHARRLRELINQLLDVAKLEAGKMPLRVQLANVVPFLRKLFASFESLAAQKKLGIRFYAEHDRIEVYYEPEKLEKIFVNLVSNAIKFTPEGGEVSASVRVSPEKGATGWVEIEVRDSGIGIPEDRLPHIFDRFYQVENGDTRDYEGTGIGLALAKELVELHSGEIRVTSKVGMGTVFKVRLPLGREHLADEQITGAVQPEENHASETAVGLKSRPALSTAGGKGSQNGRIILIVEDNPDMRQYICENLKDAYAIAEAVDGEQGFEMAQDLVPDLIISDVMMPNIDGYEMARRIRSHELTSHIPIVMLTAKAGEDEKLEGLETGVDAYLTKPFSTRELQVRVRKLIEIRQQLLQQPKQPLKITASEVAVTPVDEQFLERLQQVVEENMEDENFQVGELCRKIGIGERQLYRKLQALLGCTPAAYIRQIRLDRAKQLLEQGAGTVSEITFMVGYGNTSAFARAFREAFGKTPSEFLKK